MPSKETTPADILLKKEAFHNDCRLPLSPPETHPVQIYGVVGDNLVATGYDNVIEDGESIWLKLPENHINLTSIKQRQITSSRRYYTFNGVTLHKQLELEIERIPRRQKLAVRILRDEPSSRLQKGRWYLHVHQIKFLIGGNKSHEWRSLDTKRLIRKLRSTFGSYYHPRLNQQRSWSSKYNHTSRERCQR